MIDSGLHKPGPPALAIPTNRHDTIPLVRRFPALAAIPRARLGRFPTPVERLDGFRDVEGLWVKHEDLSSDTLGGNKVRSLEFLLGRVGDGDTVLTIGGEGSTHVLATAVHAARLGARTIAVRWRHDMHSAAEEVGARATVECAEVVTASNFMTAMWPLLRMRLTRRARYIPLGGSTPLGTLGHVNAALELADQVDAGEVPCPARVVVPLGSGGTAAGLSLGFAIAGMETSVLGARVGPRIGANRWRVLRLVEQTRQLITRYTGRAPPPVRGDRLVVSHDLYGGAYARPHPTAEHAAVLVDALRGWRLDATYSAKAFAVALDVAAAHSTPTLFWMTFDARWMSSFPKEVAGP
ncbi:MAG TPA: pyridoxal-phosphate dependent enzyme [Gemmatimonadaceae bacterium]|nr:pyridoxal-phosphate dependent enzyme [Gemmatimonadaceae bacterium]